MCVPAGVEGRFQRVVKGRLQAYLKDCETEPPKGLVEGQLLLQLCGVLPHVAASPSLSSTSVPVEAGADVSQRLVHIALHYVSPWKPTLVEMNLMHLQSPLPVLTVEPVSSCDVIEVQPQRKLSGEMHVSTLQEFLAGLSTQKTWRAAAWQLSQRTTAVPPLNGKIYVRPVRVSTTCLWSASEGLPRARMRAHAEEPTWRAFLEEGEVPNQGIGASKRQRTEQEPLALAASDSDDDPSDEVFEDAGEEDESLLQQMLDAAAQGEPTEEVAAAAPAAAANTVPDPSVGPQQSARPTAEVLARPVSWGVFRFSSKQPSSASGYGAYEVLLLVPNLANNSHEECKTASPMHRRPVNFLTSCDLHLTVLRQQLVASLST